MRKQKIYLETTLFNHYFDMEREAHGDTVRLFKEIQAGKYEAYTSTYVTDELTLAEEPKRSKMFKLIDEYNIEVLDDSEEARKLANVYVDAGIVPIKFRYDGLHIAVAVVNDLDYIFSLNFKHINKFKTKTMTSFINVQQGYKPIIIAAPMEVIEDE
jgi:predicted nucleic acid-binding protein